MAWGQENSRVSGQKSSPDTMAQIRGVWVRRGGGTCCESHCRCRMNRLGIWMMGEGWINIDDSRSPEGTARYEAPDKPGEARGGTGPHTESSREDNQFSLGHNELR